MLLGNGLTAPLGVQIRIKLIVFTGPLVSSKNNPNKISSQINNTRQQKKIMFSKNNNYKISLVYLSRLITKKIFRGSKIKREEKKKKKTIDKMDIDKIDIDKIDIDKIIRHNSQSQQDNGAHSNSHTIHLLSHSSTVIKKRKKN